MLRPEADLARLARVQHGVLSTVQCAAAGLSERQLARRVAAGRYRRPEVGVVVDLAVPPTWEQEVMTCVMAAGSGALASHATAARLWGMTSRTPPRIEVVMRRWDRAFRDFVVHESLDLEPEDHTVVRSIPVTTPERTVVDLGAVRPWLVETALSTGIRDGLFTVADVQAFVDRVGRRGRRGVGVIRPHLAARRRWGTTTESVLEDRFCRALVDAELPLPTPQFVLRDVDGQFVCRADFAYPAYRLLIELDGIAHHTDDAAFQADRSKQNRSGLLGWRTLRYTWKDVTERPWVVATQVRTALDHAAT